MYVVLGCVNFPEVYIKQEIELIFPDTQFYLN